MKLRVWAEFMTPEEICDPAVIALLRRYAVQPCLAVPHGSLGPGYARFLKEYSAAGLEPALWPTLSDELGYWPHEGNALEFSAYVNELFHWAQAEKVRIPWLAVDLETPYYQWQAAGRVKGLKKAVVTLRQYKANRNPERFAESVKTYRALQEYLRQQGCCTLVPVLPFLEADLAGNAVKLQDYLETPVTPVQWDVISVMQYNSMLVGYSRGLIKPRDAQWYLYRLCLSFKKAFGARAALSIGTTGTGKLGTEPYYKHPVEMLPDVEAALAAGIDDLAVFCLEGILKHVQPEQWFEMIAAARPAVPRRSGKAEFYRSAGRLLYRVIP
ncbi:MAG: hypothetical protein AB1767_07630 [Bacillota bacterium]